MPCSAAFPVQVGGCKSLPPRWAFSSLKIIWEACSISFLVLRPNLERSCSRKDKISDNHWNPWVSRESRNASPQKQLNHWNQPAMEQKVTEKVITWNLMAIYHCFQKHPFFTPGDSFTWIMRQLKSLFTSCTERKPKIQLLFSLYPRSIWV